MFETASDYKNRNQVHQNWDVKNIHTDCKRLVLANDRKIPYGKYFFAKVEYKLILLMLTVESASVKWRLIHFKKRDIVYCLEWMGT